MNHRRSEPQHREIISMRKKIRDMVLLLVKDQQTTEVDLIGVRPADLFDLLEKQGYSHDPIESNGWEHDFSVTFRKDGEPSLCYTGSWFDGHSEICIVEESEDTTYERESDDDMVKRITGYPTMQAMMDATNETKRSIAELHEKICGKKN